MLNILTGEYELIASPWGEVLPESLRKKARKQRVSFWPQSTLVSVPSSNAPLLYPDNRTMAWLIPYAYDASAISVEVGDMMYDATTGVAYPAGQQPSQSSLAADQVLFASVFVGISLDKVLSTETNALKKLTVLTEGVKIFDCASTTWAPGDLVGIYSNGSDSPVSQQVAKVTTVDKAIGVCVEGGASLTKVKVYFVAKNYTGWKAMAGTVGDIIINSLVGGDSSLGISGITAAQGGAIVVTGGTSSTSGNAGGAVSLVGGGPGATGVGGAVNITGAIGGATSGAGGAVVMAGGAGTNGNSAGGLISATGGAGQGSAAGGAASLVGGLGGATGAGGAIAVTGGAGGASSGAGGAVAIAGGAGTAGNGAGGAVTIAGGAPHGSGARGVVTVTGLRTVAGTTAVAITGATTLTLADSGGIFTVGQGSAYDIDLPSPTTGAGSRFLFQLVSPGANNVTITVAGGAATFEGSIHTEGATVVATGSTLTFASGTAVLGDWVEAISTATGKYFIRAVSSIASGITIA